MDIRYPLGFLFTILGVLLAGYGAVSDRALYQRSLGHNLNLSWGLCILATGLLFLFLARRGARTSTPAAASPEGRATEDREHRRGLEH